MKYSKQSSNEDLIKGCVQENRLAQKYLYERFYGQMLGICMRYSNQKEEAIEVLNSSFFKVFRSIGKYKPTGSLAGWISTIVLNTSIDFIRKQKTYRAAMDFETEKEVALRGEAMDNLLVEDIYKLIQKLPPASRNVFCLYAIDGFKHREIAQRLGISEGTSKWHYSEARKLLQVLVRRNDKNTSVSL